MSLDARKLSPSKGTFLSKWWLFVLIGISIILALVGLASFGTVDLSFFVSDAFVGGVLVMIVTALLAKMIWEGHYVEYFLETDFNHEVKIGKKRGEFSFNLEGRTFYGVDCGAIKIILLQGTVSIHEKKVQIPATNKGFSLQSFSGKKIGRLVLRALPIKDVDMILRLGWLGNDDIAKKKKIDTCNYLIKMMQSPQWAGVIWAAPSIPTELYKQYLYQEESLAYIECTYEAKITALSRESNERLTELKEYYLHIGSEVFHRACNIIKTSIQSYELAVNLVNYMFSQEPSRLQDTMAALNLESKTKTIQDVLRDELRKIEEMREIIQGYSAAIGLTPTEKEEQSKIEQLYERLKAMPETIGKKSKGIEQELPAT